jgi:ribosomal protein S18 acetylase RimI-like enzyme
MLKVYFIELIGVLPKYRGKQIGRKLISWLLSKLLEDGLFPTKELKLAVTVENVAALRLYKSLGFEVVNTLQYMRREIRSRKKMKKVS